MKRALAIVCYVWTCVSLLILFAAGIAYAMALFHTKVDMELLSAGEPPKHAKRSGETISGALGRQIHYVHYDGFGYRVSRFSLGEPIGLKSSVPFPEVFSGSLFQARFPMSLVYTDTVIPQYDRYKKTEQPADASNHSPRVTPAADAPVAPRSDGR